MSWWLWMVLGVALLVVEVTVDAAFWLLFVGLSAIVVGLGGWLGLTAPPAVQWLVFAGLSLVLLYFLRDRLRAWMLRRKEGPVEVVVGEQATAASTMAPGGAGKAMLRGAEWDARNIGATEIEHGARVRVARVNRLVLELAGDER